MKTKSAFILLIIILLIDNFCYGLIIPLVAEKLNLNTGQNAVLSSSLIIMLSPTYLIAIPIICSLSNLWGRKKVLLICLALSTVGYSLFLGSVLAGSAFLVLSSMNLSDVSTAEFPIAQAIVADIENQQQKSYFFALLTIVDIIEIISTQLHDSLLHHSIHHQLFPPIAVAVMIALVSVLNFFTAARYLPSPEPVVTNKDFDLLTDIVQSFSSILSNKTVRIFLVIFTLFSLAWSLYFQNIYYYLVEGVGIESSKASYFILYICGAMLLTLLAIYPMLIRYISLRKLLLLCLLIANIGLSIITFMSTENGSWIIGMLIAITTIMVIPILWTLLSSQMQRKHQAMLFGIAYLILTLVWEISGAIVKIFNNYNSSFALQLSAGLIFCSLILLCFYKKSPLHQKKSS